MGTAGQCPGASMALQHTQTVLPGPGWVPMQLRMVPTRRLAPRR